MNASERFWDRQSDHFEEHYARLEKQYIQLVEKIRRYLTIGDIVLDYGCAAGTVTCKIAGLAKEVHGIDLSSKMIEAAKRQATERKVQNIDFAQATIFDKRLKGESFDVILALGILHLLDNRKKVVQRINHLLKPGGWFVSSTACIGDDKPIMTLINTVGSFLGKIGILPTMRFFKISELEHLITQGNFQIVETESLPFGSEPPDQAYVFGRFVAAKKV